MAANFSSTEYISFCEGENCQSITNVTYNEKKEKQLCDNCAFTEGCIGKARKGGPLLYCDNHEKYVELYCTTHNKALCYSCAHIDHQQPNCVKQDIQHAVIESKAKLNILKEKATDQLKVCQVHGDQIRQCRKDTDIHLKALKDEVDSVINDAIKKEEDREKGDAANINLEFDKKNNKLQEEIQKINEKIRKNDEERGKRLELNSTNAEKRREPIDNKQHGLQTDIQNIAKEKENKIVGFEKSWQNDMNIRETTIQTLNTIIEDDKNVVKDGHRVYTSVNDELKTPLSLNGGEVKQITGTISGVRFVKGAGREKYDGRIDGYDGEWKLIDTIDIKDIIPYPTIVGCIDECNVIITDRTVNHHTYMLDTNTKHSRRVITSNGTSRVYSCALLNDDDKAVCGHKYSKECTGDSVVGYISVYDRQWKHINDITIQRNTTDDYLWMNVAVDQDGMITAAEWGQSKIYVINPADGKIMNTITCKQNIRMHGVLSSGHIIASLLAHIVFIIDRQGGQREIPHSDAILNACIDPMTDDLYVVTSDDEEMKCVIDQVMSGGDMQKRRVASFPLSSSLGSQSRRLLHLLFSRVLMTSSGKLIACDGDKILVFKKLLSL